MRFIRSKPFVLMLITSVLLIFIVLSSVDNDKTRWLNNAISVPLSPVQKFFSATGQRVSNVFSMFEDIKAVRLENEDLKRQIDVLDADNRELLRFRDENKEFRDVLSLQDRFYQYEFLSANIIAKDMGNWFDVFTIDKGSNYGIQKNCSIITSKGLVGKVISVSAFSSKVASIIDEDSSLSAIVSKSGANVVVKGELSLKTQGLCRIDYIPPDADISIGDTIETSGIGTIFPKGIMIGKVKQVKGNDNELNRYAIIEPSVNFKQLDIVEILKNKAVDISGIESDKK